MMSKYTDVYCTIFIDIRNKFLFAEDWRSDRDGYALTKEKIKDIILYTDYFK